MLYKANSLGEPFHLVLIGLNQVGPYTRFFENITQLSAFPFACPIGVLINTTEPNIYEMLKNVGVAFCLAKPVSRQKLYEALIEVFMPATQVPRLSAPIQYQISNTAPLKLIESNIHVLAVDDYLPNLKLVSALLENLNIHTQCAASGAEALEYLKQKRYDLILMDIQMPVMDGLEVTRRIRLNEQPHSHTPIIALTAHALTTEREAVLRAGMDDYLTKPIDEKELYRVIQQWSKKPLVNNNPVDTEEALKVTGNNPILAKEMLMGLVDTLPEALTAIQTAFIGKDFKHLREEVHRLHGACCYCGVPALKAAVANLEKAVAHKELDRLDDLMAIFYQEATRLQGYVNEEYAVDSHGT